MACTLFLCFREYIERNLIIRNGTPKRPSLSCVKKMGPGEVIATAMATASMTGNSMTMSRLESRMSIVRFRTAYRIEKARFTADERNGDGRLQVDAGKVSRNTLTVDIVPRV